MKLSQQTTPITKSIRNQTPGKFIRLSHGYTHYEIAGPEDGTIVVLIHGFSVPYYMWDRTFKPLTEAGFRVIRYDLYGRGLSDRPQVVYNRELFVNQLQELCHALALHQPVNLVATSMGGAIAAAYTGTYPEQVGALALIDPFYEKWEIGVLNIPIIGEYLYKAFVLPQAPQQQLGDFYHPENFPEWPVRFQEQMHYEGFGDALLSTLRNFMTQDPTPDYWRIKKAKKPVLLIWGTEDQVTPVNGAGKLKKILKLEFHWVEETGHAPHYERPEVVNSYLINFLKVHSGQNSPVGQYDLPQSQLTESLPVSFRPAIP